MNVALRLGNIKEQFELTIESDFQSRVNVKPPTIGLNLGLENISNAENVMLRAHLIIQGKSECSLSSVLTFKCARSKHYHSLQKRCKQNCKPFSKSLSNFTLKICISSCVGEHKERECSKLPM